MIDLRKAPNELFAQVLEGNLQGIGPARKLYGHFADAVLLRLGAECAWVMGEDAEVRVVRGDYTLCDFPRAVAFLRDERLPTARTVVLARVTVHGRQMAVVGVARRERELGQSARRTLDRLCGVLAQELARREEARLTKVLDRIRGKIVSELRPLDLAYQILDGLHQLVDYDHSSAFLTYDPAGEVLPHRGREDGLDQGEERLRGARDRRRGRWSARSATARASAASPPARSIPPIPWAPATIRSGRRSPITAASGIPMPSSLISAPLFFGGEFLGLLKIAAWKRRPFDSWDVAIVERFLPAAAASIRNARLNMSLERQAIQAELKATLVTLASAVAHDVNNAVGTILPLVQQVRADLRAGTFDADDARPRPRRWWSRRRGSASASSATCCGWRAAAGRATARWTSTRWCARRCPSSRGQAARQGIETDLDLQEGLPPVRFSRNDLHHIVLNLVNNALEAMGEKGQPGRPLDPAG